MSSGGLLGSNFNLDGNSIFSLPECNSNFFFLSGDFVGDCDSYNFSAKYFLLIGDSSYSFSSGYSFTFSAKYFLLIGDSSN